MKKFFSTLARGTLYRHLVVVFVLLGLALSGSQYLLLSTYWRMAVNELEQRLYWNAADHYARRLQPILHPVLDRERALRRMVKLHNLNPRLDIYLLEADGTQLLGSELTGTYNREEVSSKVSVELAPIQAFLKEFAKPPILGTNPYRPERRTVFSVAPVTIEGRDGYVYVPLSGRFLQIFQRGIESFYLIQVGGTVSAVLAAIAIIIGLFAFFFVTHRFRKLAECVHKIAAGDLENRVVIRGNDELSQLGSEINGMAETIQAKIAEVRDADLNRRQLVADLSHDLGGPLTSIIGYLDSLLDRFDRLDEAEQKAKIQTALSGAHSLERRAKELLELSRLESLDPELKQVPFNLTDMVAEDIVPRLTSLADSRNITLQCENLAEVVVYADFDMIERVLANLIENAIHYHDKESGTVVVKISRLNDYAEISVMDDGPGVSEEESSLMFARGYRGERSDTRPDGSGLGLAIVKKILDAHGSTITVQSTQGAGCTLSFRLPLAVGRE